MWWYSRTSFGVFVVIDNKHPSKYGQIITVPTAEQLHGTRVTRIFNFPVNMQYVNKMQKKDIIVESFKLLKRQK